ncbi:MAG: DNA-binding response regulator [Dehalococcoidia bacterium]|nr:DNA-binding response regulator [Dehalococcoidia bacterium]
MKALIVEDEPDVAELVALCLSSRWPGTTIVSTDQGTNVLQLVEAEAPDIVILDLGLPDKDGVEVLQELRMVSQTPVLVLTARGGRADRVQGLEFGADDYLAKPFFPAELLARVRAVLRRTRMPELREEEEVLEGHGLSINFTRRLLTVKGSEVALTPTEWRLLTCLARNEGMVVTHQVLSARVWGGPTVGPATIKTAVGRLRAKLADDASAPSLIHSHRGLGYRFTLPYPR